MVKSKVEIKKKIAGFRNLLGHPLCSRKYDEFLLTCIQELEWVLND